MRLAIYSQLRGCMDFYEWSRMSLCSGYHVTYRRAGRVDRTLMEWSHVIVMTHGSVGTNGYIVMMFDVSPGEAPIMHQ